MKRSFTVVAALLMTTAFFGFPTHAALSKTTAAQPPMFKMNLSEPDYWGRQLGFATARPFKGALKVRVYVLSGISQFVRERKGFQYRNNVELVSFTTAFHENRFSIVGRLKSKPNETVKLKLTWTLGNSKGHQTFVVTPSVASPASRMKPLNSRTAKEAAQGTPLISGVRIYGGSSNPKVTSFGFSICNPTRDKVNTRVVVISGVTEIIQSPGTLPLKNGMGLGGFGMGNGSASFVVYDIKAKRKQPIKLKLYWKHGNKRGVKNIVITPQMK